MRFSIIYQFDHIYDILSQLEFHALLCCDGMIITQTPIYCQSSGYMHMHHLTNTMMSFQRKQQQRQQQKNNNDSFSMEESENDMNDMPYYIQASLQRSNSSQEYIRKRGSERMYR